MRHRRRINTQMYSVSLIIIAASACTSVQGLSYKDATPIAQDATPAPPPPDFPDSPAHTAGQIVEKIDPRIWSIHQDRQGNYWFGSNGNGVYRYDGQLITHYTEAHGLSGNQVRDIEEDSKGNVFIATTQGVTKFDGTKFTTLELVESPPTGKGWKLDPDDVWLVTNPSNNGICRYDGERLYHLKLSKSPMEDAHRAKFPNVAFSPSGVYSIYKDKRGHLWFGTSSVGLCRYDGQTLSWMYEDRLTNTPTGGSFGIRSVYQDNAGDFWICNTRQRFEISPQAMHENGYSVLKFKKKKGLPDAQSDMDENFDYYLSMTEDDAGALWMACGSAGVWKYEGNEVTKYPIGNGAYTICIYCDKKGKLWVGTIEQGVFILEGERFEPFIPHETSN